jgi:hypothetical protein
MTKETKKPKGTQIKEKLKRNQTRKEEERRKILQKPLKMIENRMVKQFPTSPATSSTT